MKDKQVNNQSPNSSQQDCLARLDGQHFSTENQPRSSRLSWLKEVIGREYANVDVRPHKDQTVFNDMLIYPWQSGVKLSPIKTHSLQIERLAQEPTEKEQDCYFAVVLTSGKYRLEQAGREVTLEKGDIALYDATEWHRITMPEAASKIIITIPRPLLNQRITNPTSLTAKKLSAKSGLGALASSLIQTTVNQLQTIKHTDFLEMTNPVLDILTVSLNQLNPSNIELSSTQNATLFHIKKYIQTHCANNNLTPEMIAKAMKLSVRYMNNLFNAEDTSLMRYVTEQRLFLVQRRLSSQRYKHRSITELAMESGFNNMAHFSRVFKNRYGISPRQFRNNQ